MRGTLRIGELCGAGGSRFVEVLKAFEAQHPDCQVIVHEDRWADSLGPLLRGEVDLAATWLPIKRQNLVVGPVLKTEPRVLAVADDHPLARRTSVTLEDVADHRVARIDSLPHELIAHLVPFETPSGRPIPRAPFELRSLAEISAQVALGRIVHPTVPSFDKAVGRGPKHSYVPITGMPPSRTALAWRGDNRDPRVREFVRTTRRILEDTTLDVDPPLSATVSLDLVDLSRAE